MSNWYKQAKQQELTSSLIRLGEKNPELRDDIRPVLDRLGGHQKEAGGDFNLEGVDFDFGVRKIIESIAQYSKGGKVKLKLLKGSLQVHIDPTEEAKRVNWEEEVTGSSVKRVSLQRGKYVQVWFD